MAQDETIETLKERVDELVKTVAGIKQRCVFCQRGGTEGWLSSATIIKIVLSTAGVVSVVASVIGAIVASVVR